MPVNTRLQVRRGSGELWTNVNPTLYDGEIGYEIDTGKFKIGNGQIAWTTLDYTSVPLNSGNFISYSGVSGSGINIDFADDQSSATWYIDTDWLANFIANSSGALNVEGVQDIIGNSGIVGGFGINKDYDDGTGFTTVSVTGMALRVDESTGIGVSVTTENSNNVYTVSVTGIEHTLVNDWTEAVQDTVGTNAGSGFLVNSTGVAWTYNDGSDELSVAVTGIPHTLITDWDAAVSGSVPDNVNTLLVEGTGIGFIYNSGLNSLTIGVTGTLEDLSVNLTSTASELNVLDGVTPGTVSAGDAVVVDASKNIGDFNVVTAVTFSGDLAGNADTATESTNVTVSANNTTNETVYLTFVDAATGTQGIETDTDLIYNPSTNLLSSPNITATGTVTAGHIDVTTLTSTGNVTVGGDLTVAGTTTTVNSTVVEIGDNIIRVNTSGLPTGGLEVRNSGTSDYKQLIWNNANGRWEFSGGEDVYTSGDITANILTSTVLGPTSPLVVSSTGLVNNLNADLLDGEEGSYYLNWTNFTNLPDPVITVNLTGDVAGSGSYTWTDLNGNPTINISSITVDGVQPNSVALSGDTTGDYVESVNVSGTGLSIDVTSGEAQKTTITSNASPTCGTGTIVSRDNNDGGFCAGTIVASGFIGNGSGITNIDADNIVSGTVAIDRLPLASTVATGIAVFSSGDFDVSIGGSVTIKESGVSNIQLVNDSVTFGDTEVALGSSSDRIDGLAAISGVSAANPTVLTFCTIDGGSP